MRSNDWINKQKQKIKQLTVLLFFYGREHKIYARYKNLKSAYFPWSPHFLFIGTFYSLFHILCTNKIKGFPPVGNFANLLNIPRFGYYRYEIIFPPSAEQIIICESYIVFCSRIILLKKYNKLFVACHIVGGKWRHQF